MIHGKKIVVVMPAYQAESTLEKTYHDIPHDTVDDIILVDDASRDNTAAVAKKLGITTIIHEENTGYGGNQKTCYRQALNHDADIVVMLHPDYQYDPRLITSLASMIASEVYDAVIGSRILGKGALKGGMPVYKYISNRFLTLIQNWMLNYKLSEYHTGYRAFSREILEKLPLHANSDDFLFDNEMLSQIIFFRWRLGEVSCPTRYMDDSSSVSFINSVKYGLGVFWTCFRFILQKSGLAKFRIFSSGRPD